MCPGAQGPPPGEYVPPAPNAAAELWASPLAGWRDVLRAEGPSGWARAVRRHKGVLITDTTMCEQRGSDRAGAWPCGAFAAQASAGSGAGGEEEEEEGWRGSPGWDSGFAGIMAAAVRAPLPPLG